eukprot:symbB.v1.2.030196.t1/scaffold3379.1/size58058/1
MLGSTAVAKQLLREIADKLVADNIAPEALFVSASVRSDGLLSREELSRILLAYLPGLSSTVLSEAFHLCDWDHSGWINIEEFVTALRREASGMKEVHPVHPATVDVSVTVPASWRYGTQLQVTYEGHLYYVDVPGGHTIGSTFVTTLSVPLP